MEFALIIVLVFVGLILLFWVGKIFFVLQKSQNEILKALNSIDQRLASLESNRKGD